MRNDGVEPVHAPIGFFIDSGGAVEFFSPTSSLRGFGYRDLSPETISGEPLTLLAFRGERGSHAYLPEPDPTLDAVEGLGHFLELEVVLAPGQSPVEGEAIARGLMAKLGVRECDLVEGAYADLLAGR